MRPVRATATRNGTSDQADSEGTSAIPVAQRRAGTDESGKGDYFGPLVIAAVAADFVAAARLSDWGVTDSKKLSDGRAQALARQIVQAKIPHTIVAIGPEKYNELHGRMKNLNRLLAWGHARAIENLLEITPVELVIADQFGDAALIEKALFAKGRSVRLVQMPQGERDVVVAAASVMARADFLRRLKALSQATGVDLPKGAGPPVDDAAARIIARFGVEKLTGLAKCHFKNTAKAQSLAAGRR
ncbi:MAG: ribonuclease HIII [Candidatus Zixiibacteriota bacterium]